MSEDKAQKPNVDVNSVKDLFNFSNDNNENSNFSLNSPMKNKFLDAIRRVIKILKLDNDNLYAKILEQNIIMATDHVENNLEEFLVNLNIPFSTERFLLLLFQELYGVFMEN